MGAQVWKRAHFPFEFRGNQSRTNPFDSLMILYNGEAVTQSSENPRNRYLPWRFLPCILVNFMSW
jgi:hypothetical protein